MLYGKELAQSIQKRCRIQPGMLVSVPWSTDTERWVKKSALVIGLSPGCKFDRDYESAEDHIFYYCKPLDGSQVFVDYVCNMEKIQ